jgi:hypothetical protein
VWASFWGFPAPAEHHLVSGAGEQPADAAPHSADPMIAMRMTTAFLDQSVIRR